MDQKHHTNDGKPNDMQEKLRSNLKTQGWWWYTRTPAQPHVVNPSFLFLALPCSSFHFLFVPLFFLFFIPFYNLFLSLFFLILFHFFHLFYTFSHFLHFHRCPHLFHPPCSSLFTYVLSFFRSFSSFASLFNNYSLTTVSCIFRGRAHWRRPGSIAHGP